MQLLVERVEIAEDGLDVRLRTNGLAGLIRESEWMRGRQQDPPGPSTLPVRVPFTVQKRGGRKLVVTPDGTAERPRPRIDSALVKAIARAHRWQRMLESGEYSSISGSPTRRRLTAPTSVGRCG